MDKELERLKKEYPIGSKIIYSSEIIDFKLPYNNKSDLDFFRMMYRDQMIILDDCTIYVEYPTEKSAMVDGYLYTENGWNLVKDTWDGFVIIEEPNKEKGQKCLKPNE